MPSYVTPKKNTAYVMQLSLPSVANSGKFQSSPTLATGDVKVSKDGGALANITTLPTATGQIVELSLSASEMNADNVAVIFSDAAGDEWGDVTVNIQTTAVQIDDLATASALATVDSNVDAILVDTGTTIPATIATVDANVDAILVDTATTIPAQITGLNNISSADVNAACDTALADYDAPTKAEMDTAFTEIKGATFSGATDSLEAIRDRGDVAWITGAGGSAPTEADIYTYFTSLSREDLFKADVSGLASQVSVNTIDTNVDSILADTNELQLNQGNWLTATGFSTFNPAVDVVANVTLVDTVTTNTDMVAAPDNASIAAIKAKTDSFTFTVANQVDANIQYVNDVQVGGTGSSGDEWGPA